MADISSVAVEGQDRDRPSSGFVRGPHEKRAQSFAIWSRQRKFFEVFDAELRRSWNFCSSSWWYVPWIDDLAVAKSVLDLDLTGAATYFCQ